MIREAAALAEIAEEILKARQEGKRLGAFEQMYPGHTIETAYVIQDALCRMLEKQGHHMAGYKVAYTSDATRRKNNVSESCFGRIPETWIVPPKVPFPMPKHGVLKAEPEVVLLMGEDLTGPRITLGDAILAVAGWMPGFELVIPVFKSETTDLCGEIAENMSFGALVPGGSLFLVADTDWERLQVRFSRNGSLLSQAGCQAVMDGGPLFSLVWLANRLLKCGLHLKKGDLILTGSPVPPVFLQSGDTVRAEFGYGADIHSVCVTIGG